MPEHLVEAPHTTGGSKGILKDWSSCLQTGPQGIVKALGGKLGIMETERLRKSEISLVLTAVVVFLVMSPSLCLAQTSWTKYAGNPVLDSGSGSRHFYHPSVIKENGIYKMWHSVDNPPDGIYYATSPDGTTWTQNPANPVLPISSVPWASRRVGEPTVVKESGIYRMWFDGLISGQPSTIGYAISLDGISWTLHGNGPVLEATEPWETGFGGLEEPEVVHHGGLFRMWYSGHNFTLGYATSTDGINWTKYAGNPVITGAATPTVVFDGTTYYMWYYDREAPPPEEASIGYASSPDGINWTKFAGNPVITVNTPVKTWELDQNAWADVVLDGSLLEMWFTARDQGHRYGIGYATSQLTATSEGCSTPAPNTLPVPTNLMNPANGSFGTAFTLSWNRVWTGCGGYEVQWRPAGVFTWASTTISTSQCSGSTCSTQISIPASNSKSHALRVRSFWGQGGDTRQFSSWSATGNIEMFTTKSEPTGVEVTFACAGSQGSIVATVVEGPQGGVVCSSYIPGRVIELEAGREYLLSISCPGPGSCRWDIGIEGADFGGGEPGRRQASGSLSPGDSTGIVVTPHPPATGGLVAHYAFLGNLNDQSGNDHHGLSFDGLFFTQGEVDQAASFDGTRSFIEVPGAALPTSENFSISVRFRTSADIDSYQGLIEKAADEERTVQGTFVRLAISRHGNAAGPSRLHLHLSDADDSEEYELFSDEAVTDGLWHHGIAVLDLSQKRARLYVDGVLNSELSIPGFDGFEISSNAFLGTHSDGQQALDGICSEPSVGCGKLLGEIDELRIYNRVLRPSEIEKPGTQFHAFPQLALGGGYEVSVFVSSTTDQPWSGRASLRQGNNLDWSGSWSLDGIDQSGETGFNIHLPPQATRKYVLRGGGDVRAGFLMINGTNDALASDVFVSLFYTLLSGELVTDSVGILPADPGTHFSFAVEKTPQADTGFAFFSSTVTSPFQIQLRLVDQSGIEIQQKAISYSGQEAQFFSQIFDGVPDGFVGKVTLESEESIFVVVLRLENAASDFQLTSIPVTRLKE